MIDSNNKSKYGWTYTDNDVYPNYFIKINTISGFNQYWKWLDKYPKYAWVKAYNITCPLWLYKIFLQDY